MVSFMICKMLLKLVIYRALFFRKVTQNSVFDALMFPDITKVIITMFLVKRQ